ncbi:hypothetical protein BGX27_009388 [Mortierella sp. AM989]|nr:hypothetical protein BGX27_009388 [Mortierella sp. AM989]
MTDISLPVHPLGIPEIVLHIAQYLDVPDILTCYGASKSLQTILRPLVWRDIHFGQPLKLDPDQEPFIRRIHFQKRQQDDEDSTLKIFQENETWIKSLSIYSNASFLPLKLAEICTRLESLTLRGFSSCSDSKEAAEYWDCYRRMILKQRTSLRSIGFVNWVSNPGNIALPDDPLWNLVSKPDHVQCLRSLSLKLCRIRGRHLFSFSVICQQLESLELIETEIDLPSLRIVIQTNNGSSSEPTQIYQEAQYPKLQELNLQQMSEQKPLQQLELLICECPKLRTLTWGIPSYHDRPKQEFFDFFAADKWPSLESITITCPGNFATNQDFARMLNVSKYPLRRLDMPVNWIESNTFDLLRSGHFATIQTIDLTHCDGIRGDWTIEVLTSCPSLEIIKAKAITKQEIIDANPWVCLGLKQFIVFIDMGMPKNGPNGRFTKEEILQCHAIFQRLAALKELRVLDMLSPYVHIRPILIQRNGDPRCEIFSPVSLPIRLRAGLGLLRGLTKLEMICFWAGLHATPKEELVWMTDHWKRLKRVIGGWRIAKGTAASNQNKYLWAGELHQWMAAKGVITKSGCREEYEVRDYRYTGYEDCCGFSDDEGESGNM